MKRVIKSFGGGLVLCLFMTLCMLGAPVLVIYEGAHLSMVGDPKGADMLRKAGSFYLLAFFIGSVTMYLFTERGPNGREKRK